LLQFSRPFKPMHSGG